MGGSPNLAPNSILMVLVDLDVHQIVGYHYFDHHQPCRGVRLGYFRAGTVVLNRGPGGG